MRSPSENLRGFFIFGFILIRQNDKQNLSFPFPFVFD